MSPTNELYEPLISAYNYLNHHLFDDKLPEVIFTLQRKKGVMGFFSAKRWGNTKGNYCSEIAINPAYFASSRMIEVMQTLVHEMVHCWQYAYGTPSDHHYHNQEWAKKMMSIGLMPSSTGEPGGRATGRNMSDFIIQNGKFFEVVSDLIGKDSFQLSWVDRYALPKLFEPIIAEAKISKTHSEFHIDEFSEFDNVNNIDKGTDIPLEISDAPVCQQLPEEFFVQEVAKKQTRTRYTCPSCEVKVYGKFYLSLICGDCDCKFVSDE